jgi:UDP-N-acetylmuramoyl-tripeptide--D-alanyl-D-alanine ligase
LKGGNFNGNRFVKEALDGGANLVVIDEEYSANIPASKVLMVDDVLQTLSQLAHYHRHQLRAKVIGLTGSNGKTTTKEILFSILKSHFPHTYATEGNYNNHIGVPLSILSIPLTAQYAIIEMGTNQPGDIAQYCEVAQPDYGLITNIGKTHLEKLINQEGVFEEKKALYESIIDNNGVFFKNEGDPFLLRITEGNLIDFSKDMTELSSFRVVKGSTSLTFDLVRARNKYRVKTNLFGDFNMENIAAAISIAEYFEVPIDKIIHAIEAYVPQNMRSQILKTERNTIILDAYNANPFSLKAALREFAEMDAKNKLAIIGDMLELGKNSHEEHHAVVKLTERMKHIKFIYIGEEFGKVMSSHHHHYDRAEECAKSMNWSEITNYHVFLKGSRGIALEKLKEYL